MCTNYRPSSRDRLEENFDSLVRIDDDWDLRTFKDYPAPIIRVDAGSRVADLASYSMVPKQHLPPGVKPFSTMNARAETIGQLRSYAKAWREGQRCLVPLKSFNEPNYESGANVWFEIGMADWRDFAVAGLWKEWNEADGKKSLSFTQITINAEHHPLMNRFHKPGDEKRSLVVVRPEDYDEWLTCKDPEVARSLLQLFPAELMAARPDADELKRAATRKAAKGA